MATPPSEGELGPLNCRVWYYILLLVENANDGIIHYSLAIFLSIQSAVLWSENNLNWTKTSAALTDSYTGFFLSLPPAPAQPSLFYEYTVSQSGISWWLNKLFDFWIILRLTEFEMWAACNVLLAQKMSFVIDRDLHMTFFIIIRLCQTTVHFSLASPPEKECCKAKFKSAIYNLLSPVNFTWH